ncbi:DUF123 domain-containing protein [Desulfofundulus sp. TPOSR]|uniref:DUF123 domain-containing protein n=1 Tax=Desulfofundulus sp. TPOSR TaxID=2714340 RepID=UPI0037C15867
MCTWRYVYVGLVMGGLRRRVRRPLYQDKKLHWCIDYLLEFGKPKGSYYKQFALAVE